MLINWPDVNVENKLLWLHEYQNKHIVTFTEMQGLIVCKLKFFTVSVHLAPPTNERGQGAVWNCGNKQNLNQVILI